MTGARVGMRGAPPRPEGPVLFFDGDCILCNGFADFVLRRDRRHALRLATLQGETAAVWLARGETSPSVADAAEGPGPASGPDPGPGFRSVVLYEAGATYRKSEAVRRVLRHLGGAWRVVASLFGLVPRGVRDAVYDVVARHRFRWFGRRAACRMPAPEERDRFLP